MGIQDLLGSMGSSSASPRMAGGLPAYSEKDAANAKAIAKEMGSIDELIRTSGENWEKMGQAKALINVKKALEDVEAAEKEFNEAMNDSNSTLEERAVLYEKLAKVKNDQIDIQNEEVKKAREAEGMFGRAKNVMMDMARNWKTLGLGVLFKGLSILAKDATESFDILAESSQLTNISFGEMAQTAGAYAVEIELASVKAMQFGVSSEDSTKAFAQLTKTFGGTRDVVNDLGDSWSDIVQIAKVSGLGMAGFTELATQGMVRLGESMDDAKQNAVDISTATAGMNARFGTGSANAKEFSNAVTSLAYSQGFFNQNTKMVIDTLAREVNMQLALGRSKEAALQIAKDNVKMAGEVNIFGAKKVMGDLTSGYAGAKDKKAWLAENVEGKYGADSGIIADMLQKGSMNLFAMEEMMKNSSSMQQKVLLDINKAAARGDRGAMLKYGVEYGEVEAKIAQQGYLNTQLGTIASGDNDASNAMIKALFGDQAGSKENMKFVEDARSGKLGTGEELFEAFYKLADNATSEPGEEKKKGSWQSYIKDTKGKGWFMGATKILGTIADWLSKIFLAAGAAGTVMGLGGAGAGIGALLGSAGLAGLGTAITGILSTLAMIAVPVLAAVAVADMIYNAFTSDSISEWAGKTADFIFGSLLDFSEEDLKALSMGSLKTPLTSFADALAGVLDWFRDATLGKVKRLIFGDNRTETEKLDEAMTNEYEHSKKQGYDSASGTKEEYIQRMALRKSKEWGVSPAEAKKRMLAERTISSGKTEASSDADVVEDADPGTRGKNQGSGNITATATGSLSGKVLTFEVHNWGDIYAQTVNEAADIPG